MTQPTTARSLHILRALLVFSTCAFAMKQDPIITYRTAATNNPIQGLVSSSPVESTDSCDAVYVMARLAVREAEERLKLQTVLEARIAQLESDRSKLQTLLDSRISQLESERGNIPIGIEQRLLHLESTAKEYGNVSANCTKPRDCAEVKCCGSRWSGVYKVYPSGDEFGYSVYCELQEDQNDWTVIQRRQDGSVNFDRPWRDYERGFGNLFGEFWLGLANIHNLLSGYGTHELMVKIRDFTGETTIAKYDLVSVSGAGDKYRLHLGRYSGTAGDSMAVHNGMRFSTKDNDNDVHASFHCAKTYRGGWWHSACYGAHLNGLYCDAATTDAVDLTCLSWFRHNKHERQQYVEIMVKRRATPPTCSPGI